MCYFLPLAPAKTAVFAEPAKLISALSNEASLEPSNSALPQFQLSYAFWLSKGSSHDGAA